MVRFIFLFIFILGCNDSVETYSLPKKKQKLESKQPKTDLSNASIVWDTPKHWLKGNKTAMSLENYSIPYDNKYADLSITVLTGDGGGILSNVNRWRGQINLSPESIATPISTAKPTKARFTSNCFNF